MTLLALRDVCVTLEKKEILSDVSFTLEEGSFFMIAGPNGAGKTTIIRAVAGSVPYSGMITYKDSDIRTMKADTLAKHIGVLAQNRAQGFAFTVGEVVRLGRYAYGKGLFRTGTDEADEAAVRHALAITGMAELEQRPVSTLSGGEIQRTFLAQLFAQDPEILILDEPANHLDPVYQKQLFTLVDAWRRETGRAVLCVVHDLSFAKTYGTDALLLGKGRIVAQGKAGDVFTAQHLERTYGMDVAGWMREILAQWD